MNKFKSKEWQNHKNIDLSIIIVNWNTKPLLYNCLKSIFDNLSEFSYEVIVVDNGSSDGSTEIVRQNFPQVKLIENKENLGFAKANNQAIKSVKNSKYVLLLNSDVAIKDDAIQRMIEFLEINSDIGVVGPALRLPNGKLQKGGVGGYFPSLLTGFNYFFFLSFLFPKIFKGVYITQRPFVKNRKEIEVDWIAGTCLMTRLEIIKKVGGLDESIFIYTEDIEWNERIKKAGWRIFYLPYIEVIHHLYGSQKQISYRGIQALVHYILRKYGFFRSSIFRVFVFSGLLLRFFIYFMLFLFSGAPEYREKSYKMFIFSKGALK